MVRHSENLLRTFADELPPSQGPPTLSRFPAPQPVVKATTWPDALQGNDHS